MINVEKGVSNIHRLVQKVIRLQNQSKEEEILEKALKLINSADIANELGTLGRIPLGRMDTWSKGPLGRMDT
jgi:hypothetical protein